MYTYKRVTSICIQNKIICIRIRIYVQRTIINMYFYMIIVLFYSRLLQYTHQNASIVKRFQIFLHENYLIASVYLYKNGI